MINSISQYPQTSGNKTSVRKAAIVSLFFASSAYAQGQVEKQHLAGGEPTEINTVSSYMQAYNNAIRAIHTKNSLPGSTDMQKLLYALNLFANDQDSVPQMIADVLYNGKFSDTTCQLVYENIMEHSEVTESQGEKIKAGRLDPHVQESALGFAQLLKQYKDNDEALCLFISQLEKDYIRELSMQ